VKQKSVSLSTAESEWYAASEAGKELLYLRIIMREFGFPQLGPMHLYEDSRAVIATNKMVADALTKNLPAPAFEQHRATMLGEDSRFQR